MLPFCGQLVLPSLLKFLSITDFFLFPYNFTFSRKSHKHQTILENSWPLFLKIHIFFYFYSSLQILIMHMLDYCILSNMSCLLCSHPLPTLFSWCFSLSNFYCCISKYTLFIFVCIKFPDESIKGILNF